MANNKQLKEVNKKTRFSNTRQPQNKRGRGKSELKDYFSTDKVSFDDFKRLIFYVAMGKTRAELKALKSSQSIPAIICLFASVFENAIKQGRMHDINLIIDRLYGKSAQFVNNDITLKDYTIIAAEPYNPAEDKDLLIEQSQDNKLD